MSRWPHRGPRGPRRAGGPTGDPSGGLIRPLVAVAATVAVVAMAACAAGAPPPGPVAFARDVVWMHSGPDSVRLTVEIAASSRQQEVGLSGRASLGRDEGMLFLFPGGRSGRDGFWMHGTNMPLDIAFLDEADVVVRILEMEPCPAPADEDDCPGYFPDVRHWAALEVNRGWFDRNGVGLGSRLARAP